MKILGEILEKDPSRSPKQVSETIIKMKIAFNKTMWIMWGSKAPSISAAKIIFDAFITSIAISSLTLTRITKAEWKKIEAFQGKFAKAIFKLPQKASSTTIKAHLGWISMKITIQSAKLLLAGSLIRETQAIYTAHLVKIRLKETAEGDRTGLFGNCLDILEEWNASHIWEKATTQKKTKWKEIVKSAARKHQSAEWLKFAKKKQSESSSVIISEWGSETYINLPDESRKQIAAIRLGATSALGDCVESTKRRCRLCKSRRKESSKHLLWKCTKTKRDRERHSLKTNQPATWKSFLHSLEKDQDIITAIAQEYKKETGTELFITPNSEISKTDDETLEAFIQAAKWLSK